MLDRIRPLVTFGTVTTEKSEPTKTAAKKPEDAKSKVAAVAPAKVAAVAAKVAAVAPAKVAAVAGQGCSRRIHQVDAGEDQRRHAQGRPCRSQDHRAR